MNRGAVSLEAPSLKSHNGFPPTGGKPIFETAGKGMGGPESAIRETDGTGGGASATSPDLSFRVDGMPPRKTLQAGRGAYVENGAVRFFTSPEVRAEAWQMLAEFRKQLPAGWVARRDPARVRVELVYPLRKPERVRLEGTDAAEMLIPHAVKPDVDNLVKSLLDSMTRAGVWEDDGQVCDLRVRKWRGMRPRWAVFVWWMTPPAFPRRRRGREEEPEQGRLAFGQGEGGIGTFQGGRAG